jgi:hypothetical protein
MLSQDASFQANQSPPSQSLLGNGHHGHSAFSFDGSASAASQSDEDEERRPSFSCKLETLSVLLDVLNAITLEKDQLITVMAAPTGLKLVTETSRVCQAKAYIKAAVFTEYYVEDEQGVEFTVPLGVLQTSLTIFDAHGTHMEMDYTDAQLGIILEKDGTIAQCELKSQMQPDIRSDFDFRSSETAARAHINSTYLLACLQELDVPGGTIISITFDINEPHLSMSVKGDVSDIKVDFPPSKDTDVFLDFECKHTVTFQYPLSWIKASAKALTKASQSNVRVNEEGMLNMTHVLQSKENTNWVELKLSAQDTDL